MKRVLYNNSKKMGEVDPLYLIVCFFILMSIDNLSPVFFVVLSLEAKLPLNCDGSLKEKGNIAILGGNELAVVCIIYVIIRGV